MANKDHSELLSKSEKIKKNHGVAGNALGMSLGTLGSRVLGLGRDILLASLFSLTVKDAFVVAFRLPNLFRRLLGEGSLSVSFLPIYVDKLEREGFEEANKLASAIWSLLMVITATLSVLGILFMDPIINLLVSGDGFQQVNDKLELTILMARIMFFYLFLVTSYAFLTAVAQAWKKFFIPALAPALFNLGLIVFFIFPNHWFSVNGLQLAWGVLFGGLIQLFLVVWQLFKIGKMPSLTLGFRVPGLKKVLLNVLPGIAGLGVGQLITIINVNYASRLGEGTHSYIYFADRILELPQSLIAISLGAALLPALSRLYAKNQVGEMQELCHEHLGLMYFLSLPAAIGMWVLAEPMVRVLFMRGAFSEQDVLTTSLVLKLYAFLLMASSFVKVLLPSFYAIKNTWYPAAVAGICLVVHFVLANYLVNLFGLEGLVGSTVFNGFLNGFLLLVGYYMAIGPFKLLKFLRSLAPFTIPSLAMGLYLFFTKDIVLNLLEQALSWAFGRNLIHLIFMIASATVIYFYISFLLKVEAASLVSSTLKRKVFKK